jgi:hypothetical protein
MHFFTEYQDLIVQVQGQSFGPDPASASIKYNATARFTTTKSLKAFACQNGRIIVQQSSVNANLVNVILKPNAGSSSAIPDCYYYIYRGLLKNSFFDASLAIIDDSSSNTELRTRIKSARTNVNSYSAKILGYDNNQIVGTNSIESIFDNSAANNVRPMNIKEGEWFGNFSVGEIGFEIITEFDKINATLDFSRKDKSVIDTTGLSGFALRSKKEQILAFVDPSAFFASYYNEGFKVSTYVGATKSTVLLKTNDINAVLNKFYSKNRVYLDIRSEKGYSYNFYQNYSDGNGNNLKMPAIVSYQTQGWPIVFYEKTQNTNLTIHLRINDNAEPCLYSFDKSLFIVNPKSNFIKITGDINGWSNAIVLKTPNSTVFSYHIKLYYFRNIFNQLSPATVLVNKKGYDSAFCSIDLPTLGNNNEKDKWVVDPNINYIREPLQNNGTGNFSHSAYCGAYWDNSRIVFYSKIVHQNVSSEKYFFPTYSRKPTIGAAIMGPQLDLICKLYKKDLGSGQFDDIKVLGVNNYSVGNIKDKESLFCLGVTRAELTSIQSVSGLSDKHHRYISFELTAGNPLKHHGDANGNRFFEYKVVVQGLDDFGNQKYVTPTKPAASAGTPILVYSRDNLFFNSKDFSASEVVTVGANQIEFHIYSDGVIKINDNIELALIYQFQRIYYKFKNETTGAPLVDICNLQIFKADKMKRRSGNGGIIPAIPAGYTRFKTYPSGDATASYKNAGGDIVSTGSGGIKQYLNQNKTIFLVYVEPSLFNAHPLGINFTYSNTQRRYAEPSLAAALFGALIDMQTALILTGYSFADGSCYPSAEHVNGEALDSVYLSGTQANVNFAVALNKYGFNLFRIGLHTAYRAAMEAVPALANKIHPDLSNLPGKSKSLHDSHFHSTDVVLRTGNKNL